MKTKELLRILNLLMVAVEKKAVVSQYDHFVFYDGAISTFNGKIFISIPVNLDIECSVVAEDLLNIIKTVEDEEVSLNVVDSLLKVESKDVSAELSTEVYEDNVVKTIKYLDIGKFQKEDYKKVPDEFLEAISNCRFSVSKDASCSLNMNCIHIVDDVVESTDSYRCSEYIMDGKMEEMLIPASSASSLLSFNPSHYIRDDGWAHFIDADDVFFSVAVVDGKFPDVAMMMEKAKPETKVTLPIQISNILSEFGKLSSGDSDIFKFMEVDIKGNKITCKTQKQGCNVKKKINFPESKVDLTFVISPVLLNTVLSKTHTIGINHTNNLASFSSKNFNHMMVMPEQETFNTGNYNEEGTGEDTPF